MTKILMVDIHFPPELTGVARYTGDWALELVSAGYEVCVITAFPSYPRWKIFPEYRSKRFWFYHERWQGMDIIRCPLWVPQRPNAITRLIYITLFGITSSLAALGQMMRWKPDLLIGVVPTLPSLAWFPLAHWLVPAVRTWIHIQDFEIEAALNLGMLPGWARKIPLAWETWLYRSADLVSTISNKMLERLSLRGMAREKLFLFQNWVDTELIHPLQDTSYRQQFGLGSEKILVLYSGNFGKKQGLDLLLDAAEVLRNHPLIHFVLCGDGADRAMIVDRARHLDNVTIIPLQPGEKLNLLLNMADIHALPQKDDVSDLVLPSKLAGMLASGKPVVATAHLNTELGEIIREVGVLVTPGDVRAFARALEQLAADYQKRQLLGQAGREWVVKYWSRQVLLTPVKERISELISPR